MDGTFDGTEGGEVSLELGAAMTARYRNTTPQNAVLGHFFGKENILAILDQFKCVGIRIYYGVDEYNKQQLILVGAQENGDDILDLLMDRSAPCPTQCSEANPLNSDPE